jgi:hypothetical protein
MKVELQNKLIEKYPLFFEYLKEHNGPIIPIQFGFEISDGWYWLLEQLMEEIYNYCNSNDKKIPDIIQIKEKFGSLRFYIQGGDEMIDGMIWLAESMSYKICEKCGTTENIGHTKSWIITLCETCSKEQNLTWTLDKTV